MIDHAVQPEIYWKVKAIARIMLLISICIYGIGLLLMRAASEKREANGDPDGE